MTKKTKTAPRETKSAIVLRLLSRKSGADLAALQQATGWQTHSVRAAISGLRKAGHVIERTRSKAGGVGGTYRVTAAAEST
jgi:DNA-binding transcriptional regulator PaaX